jgi:hypothetical protein
MLSKNAVSAGVIPNIPLQVAANHTYGGQDPSGPEICSSTDQVAAK